MHSIGLTYSVAVAITWVATPGSGEIDEGGRSFRKIDNSGHSNSIRVSNSVPISQLVHGEHSTVEGFTDLLTCELRLVASSPSLL